MEVKLSTSGGMVTAQLKLPRALVLSAALAIGAALTHVGATWFQFQGVKARLAECERKLAAQPAAAVGD